ncbi:MAG: hypothetical protein U0574_05860 [Phycisphaerales bacterium]
MPLQEPVSVEQGRALLAGVLLLAVVAVAVLAPLAVLLMVMIRRRAEALRRLRSRESVEIDAWREAGRRAGPDDPGGSA